MQLFYMALGDNYASIAEGLSDSHLLICIELWITAIQSIKSIKMAEEENIYNTHPERTSFRVVAAARRRRNDCIVTNWVGESCVNYAEALEFVIACMDHYHDRFTKRHVLWSNFVSGCSDIPWWNDADKLTQHPLPKNVNPKGVDVAEFWRNKARSRMKHQRWTSPGNPNFLFQTTPR